MHSIAIVGVYFGKFPNYFRLWLESAKRNSSIDFYVFTDQISSKNSDNVHFVKMSMQKFSELATEKIGLPINIKRPYKCCDFKCAYGIIFEEYLKNYDFWGYSDFDLIWGNLREFLTETILNENDRIYSLGHFSLYRNAKPVNHAFMLDGSEKGNYKQVFTSERDYAFDELRGIYQILQKNDFKQYDQYEFADISPVFKQMKVVTNYTNYDNNYKYQIFVWDTNQIVRFFLDSNGEVCKDYFAYLHLQKRKYYDEKVHVDVKAPVVVTPNSILNCDVNNIDKKFIKKSNKYYGKLFEYFEWKKRNWKLRRS